MTYDMDIAVGPNGGRGRSDSVVKYWLAGTPLEGKSTWARFAGGVLWLSTEKQDGPGWKGPVREKTTGGQHSGYNTDEPVEHVRRHPTKLAQKGNLWRAHAYSGKKYGRHEVAA